MDDIENQKILNSELRRLQLELDAQKIKLDQADSACISLREKRDAWETKFNIISELHENLIDKILNQRN